MWDVAIDGSNAARFTFLAFYKVDSSSGASTSDVFVSIENSSGDTVTPTSVVRTSTVKSFRFNKVGTYDPEKFDYFEKEWSGYVEIREVAVTISGSDLNSDNLISVEFTADYRL